MLVDSHCHLDFPDFADDLDGIVARAEAAGIGRMVTISTRVKRLGGLLAITERFPDVYCSVGTHPHHADEEDGIPASELIELTKHPKVVALGEAGLDYFYEHGSREAQERGFRAHIAAARATGLPLVIHARDADTDMARILTEAHRAGPFACVMHCFTSGAALAEAALGLGFYLSISGIATFRSAGDLRAIFAAAPRERSGGASGMLGTARLLGQTIGAALVALLLARFPADGTRLSLMVGVGFALVGAMLSMLRLSSAGSRGAERVRVQEGQRLKGE